MEFFHWHMPPFLSVMGAFYLVLAIPFLIGFLRQGYWHGVFKNIRAEIIAYCYWLLLLAIGELILIQYVDVPMTLWVKAIDDKIHAYTFWDFICSCAEGGFVAGVIFTIFMLAKHFRWDKLSTITSISLMSSIYGGLVNAVLKFVFNRQRPSIGLDQWHFFAFFQAGAREVNDLLYAYNSMPSGHTITTVAAVIPFFLAYSNKAARVLMIIWVLMVGFSRVYTINHWLSDVILATILGTIIGMAVYTSNAHRIISR